jgi:hypothetical protein
MADPELELVHRGNLAITDEMIFPVRVDRDMEIGAITLYLDFDPSVMVVTGVTGVTDVTNVTNVTNVTDVTDVTNVTNVTDKTTVTPVTTVTTVTNATNAPTITTSPELWFNVLEPTLNLQPETLNTLQIGWMSMEPMQIKQEETLLLIHARLTEAFRSSHFTFSDSHFGSDPLNVKPKMQNVKCEIGFALNESSISELADPDGNLISEVKLTMPVGSNGETVKRQNGKMEVVSVYPNPAKDEVYLQVVSDAERTVEVEFFNLLGESVRNHKAVSVVPGLNTALFNVRGLPCGSYMMKIRVGDFTEVRKVIVNR